MDKTPAKRPWFRFHLLSAVVAVLMAGIWLPVVIQLVQGFLWTFDPMTDMENVWSNRLKAIGCFAQILLFVFAAGCICEWAIRRRTAREKGSDYPESKDTSP